MSCDNWASISWQAPGSESQLRSPAAGFRAGCRDETMDANLRSQIHDRLASVTAGDFSRYRKALLELVAPRVRWNVCHPIGELIGPTEIDAEFWHPLKQGITGLERRDDIFVAGVFDGSEWIAATGHYAGVFNQVWLGIPPTRAEVHLRFGEVYRLEDGKITEAFILLDLIDLMRQAGVSPWRPGAGVETYSPAPATNDGVRLAPSPAGDTMATLELVMSMLGSLFVPNRKEMGMERFWSPEMAWYGPGMIGMTRGLDGFFRDHQEPWMRAFPDWQDGLEAPHFADGAYACYAGWPSIRATHTGPLFGLSPTGRKVDIRVMDWWRRDGDRLAENWILIDFPHLFQQLGIDLFQLMRAAVAKPALTEMTA
jgi:predicted ester cyclase